MAQASRISLDSEPDLVAYDSSSILPAGGAGAGYSYGPPPSVSPSDNMSRQSLDRMNINNSSGNAQDTTNDTSAGGGSPGFSNRSRARATSMASKFSNATLPLYTARDATTALVSSHGAASTSSTPHASIARHRNSTNSDDGSSRNGEHDDDSDYEDCSDDDDLEMDTLNKNSGGKGGWKMVANTDTPLSALFSPSSSHAHPPGRPSVSDEGAEHHEKVPHGHGQKGSKNSRFERFDRTEIISMLVSLALVTFLTIASLHICFSGE